MDMEQICVPPNQGERLRRRYLLGLQWTQGSQGQPAHRARRWLPLLPPAAASTKTSDKDASDWSGTGLSLTWIIVSSVRKFSVSQAVKLVSVVAAVVAAVLNLLLRPYKSKLSGERPKQKQHAGEGICLQQHQA